MEVGTATGRPGQRQEGRGDRTRRGRGGRGGALRGDTTWEGLVDGQTERVTRGSGHRTKEMERGEGRGAPGRWEPEGGPDEQSRGDQDGVGRELRGGSGNSERRGDSRGRSRPESPASGGRQLAGAQGSDRNLGTQG